MKWKANTPANPEFGDKIVKKQFAFLPTRVGEHWVWLESYYEMYEYRWGGETIGYFGTYPHRTRSMSEETLIQDMGTE